MALQLETDLQDVQRGDAEAVSMSDCASLSEGVRLPRY